MTLVTALAPSPACRPALRASQARGRAAPVVRANKDGPLREFREDTGEVSTSGSGGAAPKQDNPKFLYADENPPVSRLGMPAPAAAAFAAAQAAAAAALAQQAAARLPLRLTHPVAALHGPPAIPPIPLQPPRDTMSPEMKARLRQEYYGLGGSPNKAMGGNYFL